MDMEKPLKFEGECFGLETDSDFCDPLALKQFGMNGWDQHFPIDQIQTASIDEVVDKMRRQTSMAHTPLEELVNLAKLEFGCGNFREDQTRRILRKTKMIEKRQRAKQRTKLSSQRICFQQIMAITPTQSSVIDIKKKKNRLSAQISRDKKKQYYTKIQQQNQKLQREIAALNLQKKQLKNKVDSQRKKTSQINSSFISLLLFLGILFFLDLLKNTCTSKRKSTDRVNMSKITISEGQKAQVQDQMDRFGIKIKVSELDQSLSQQQGCFISKRIAQSLQWVIKTNF